MGKRTLPLKKVWVRVPQEYKDRFKLEMKRLGNSFYDKAASSHFNKEGDRSIYITEDTSLHSSTSYDEDENKPRHSRYKILFIEDLIKEDTNYINKKEIELFKKEMAKYD